MKNANLKKLKDGLITAFIVLIASFLLGFITVAAKNASNYQEVVITQSTEVKFVDPLSKLEVIKDFSATKLQYNSTLKQWEAHKAVDLKAEVGDKVFAVADGTVASIDSSHLLGTIIEIKHSGGFVTRYASLSDKTLVKVGDKVSAGDTIATIDTTAKGEIKEGAHLHFELLKDNTKIDPNLYFTFGQK